MGWLTTGDRISVVASDIGNIDVSVARLSEQCNDISVVLLSVNLLLIATMLGCLCIINEGKPFITQTKIVFVILLLTVTLYTNVIVIII